MKLTITDRTNKPVNAGYCTFQAEQYTWNDEGGPRSAVIVANGSLQGLTNLLAFLRFPVLLSDENGANTWWGFINSVEIHIAGVVYSVSLSGMWNRVAVRYRAENPLVGDSSDTWQYQTPWVDDLNSQALYGVKEQVFNLGESRLEHANAAALTYLNRLSLPVTSTKGEDIQPRAFAVLRCLGWWETLKWKFYSEVNGYTGNIETSVGGINYPFGQAAGTSQVEQQLSLTGNAAWLVRNIWMKLYSVGAPADNLIIEVMTAPSAGVVLTQTVAGSTISKDSASWYVFTFSGTTLTNGTTYYVRLRRSGAVSAVNYYGVKVEENSLLGANQFFFWNGAAWTARVPSASAILGIFGYSFPATQFQAMAAAAPLLSGSLLKLGSGSPTVVPLFRSGKNRIQAELLDLAKSAGGTSAGLRCGSMKIASWLSINGRSPVWWIWR